MTEEVVLGDRSYALIDAETGKVVSAKEREAVSRPIGVSSGFCRTTTSGGRDSPGANRSPEWHVRS